MARPGFKRWWTRFIPEPIERSTYVLLSSLLLILLFWQWRPILSVVWNVTNRRQSRAHSSLLGRWLLVLLSTFVINHFDLFGLRQVYLFQKGKQYTNLIFKRRFFYKFVRTLSCSGSSLRFGDTENDSGHLVFAVATTATF